MKDNLRVAHIGTGRWGKNIVRNLHELGVLEVLCDADQKVLQSFGKQYPGVSLGTEPQRVFENKDIDAVTIATPAATHFELVREALGAGKDVFVEKPLALRPEEGEELARLAKQKDRILMVGHILRYHPAVLRIKELIDEGALGRVGYCYSNRLNLGRVRKEENILWSFAPHDISLFNYLMGGPPDEVSASGEVILQPGIHDVTLTVLKWRSGVMAHIYVSWLHPFKEHRLVVVGDKAMLVFDDTQKEDKLVLYDRGIDFIKGEPVKRDGAPRRVEFEAGEPLRKELEHFLACVRDRTQPHTDATEALAVLRVLNLAQSSLVGSKQAVGTSAAKEFFVHPTAVVDAGAEIGVGTKIWHFSHVMPGARIGARCSLGQNVFVGSDVRIGDNVKIQNNVSVYQGVILEDDCFCGPSMVFTNVKTPRSAFPRNRPEDYLTTHVKKGATLGANCTIVCGITIGENAFVAAGAVVAKDVPPHALVAGVPARQLGWMCHCGVKLREKGERFHCPECGRKYRLRGKQLQLV
ncbi:MAG: oxidoreductase [Calditrichaeota bacterium]|nr:MAG: oxidoreductase [Calditrichota bacterium]